MNFILTSTSTNRDLRRRYSPKLGLMLEVIAGFLWLYLDLPEDLTREELDKVAEQLMVGIVKDGGEMALIAELARIQSEQFCRTPNLPNIEFLARRTLSVVRTSGAGCY